MSDIKMKPHLIDIHTHITPNVDDGANSLEMSLEMLRSEVEQGGNVVFLTPHCSAFAGSGSAGSGRKSRISRTRSLYVLLERLKYPIRT